jgi:hypothetical protein
MSVREDTSVYNPGAWPVDAGHQGQGQPPEGKGVPGIPHGAAGNAKGSAGSAKSHRRRSVGRCSDVPFLRGELCPALVCEDVKLLMYKILYGAESGGPNRADPTPQIEGFYAHTDGEMALFMNRGCHGKWSEAGRYLLASGRIVSVSFYRQISSSILICLCSLF